MTHDAGDELPTVRATGTGGESAEAAQRTAVRAAEQAVSDAWIGQLLLAEAEAEAAVGACTRVRDRTTDRIRAAQRAGRLDALVASQIDLERADRAYRRALASHDRARNRLAEELAAWTDATARRARQAGSDRSATFARRGAGHDRPNPGSRKEIQVERKL